MKLFLISILIIGSQFLISCATKQAEPTPVVSKPAERIPGSWEKNCLKNKDGKTYCGEPEWTDHLDQILRPGIPVYAKAPDMTDFCPKFKSLSENLQTMVLREFWISVTVHESGFKNATIAKECRKTECVYSGGCNYYPEHGYCMKGGHKLDGNIVISRGLEQISLESAQGYGCTEIKTPQDLHDPKKNLTCANIIMKKQINSKGALTVKSNYWAVLKTGGKYNQIAAIKSRVLKYAPECK